MVSFVWIYFGKSQYAYNHIFFKIGEFAWFPFLAWSFGLFLVYSIYLFLFKKINTNFIDKFFIFSFLYWTLLIIVETLGYHFFNIHNLAAAGYKGLPICDCMHAPLWMKMVYFMLGPLYFISCEFYKLINNWKNNV